MHEVDRDLLDQPPVAGDRGLFGLQNLAER
jgi:hypothetical protein